MQQLFTLPNRPQSAVDAEQSRDITIKAESSEVMLTRTRGVLDFLGLNDVPAIPCGGTIIPDGLPHAFYPDPRVLFAAMGKKLSPRDFSAVCLQLLDHYGDGIGDWLRGRLSSSLVKPDPTNLKGWSSGTFTEEDGHINVYERGFSPITRFQTGEEVYNLPARDGRKPLLDAGATPGSLLEWAISFALFPDLKAEIVRVDPWVVHPGTRVRSGVYGWSLVSYCWEIRGRAKCGDCWGDYVYPKDALFSLL